MTAGATDDAGNAPDARTLLEALRLLAKRPLLVAELRAKLLGKGLDDRNVDAVIDHLSRRGFLKDQSRLDSILARSADERRGFGRMKAEQELLRIGATEEQAQQALSKVDDESELVKMGVLLRRKYPAGGDRARAGRFLVSRGFEEGLIEMALDRFLGEG